VLFFAICLNMREKYIVLNDERYLVINRTHRRARSIKLKLTELNQIVISSPYPLRPSEVNKLVEDSSGWLFTQLSKRPPRIPFIADTILPILGKTYTLHHQERLRSSVWVEDNTLIFSCPTTSLSLNVEKWVKEKFRDHMTNRSEEYASLLKTTFNAIHIKGTKSRWGSCSSNRNLSFCWHLAFAPTEIADYVCAHEVSHLLEMNHSPRFWHWVEQICPDYKNKRRWLKQNAQQLTKYG